MNVLRLLFGSFLALVASASGQGSAVAASEDLVSALTFTAHRPSGAVFAMAQTPDGYLWFGTATGLYRYDGVRFTHFSPENTPALTHPRINHLAVTNDGRLWVASGHPGADIGAWDRGGPGLIVYNQGAFRRFGVEDGLPSEWVQSLASSADNRLWVGTTKGLAVLEGNHITALGAPAGSNGQVFHVRPDERKRVWVGCSLGLARFEAGRFVVEVPRLFPLFSARGADGTLWMTNLHAVYNLRPSDDSWQHVANGAQLSMSDIRAVTSDAHGSVWIAGSGIAQVDLKTMKASRVNALDPSADPSRHVAGLLFFDQEGNLWVGTREGGAYQGAPKRVLNLDTREGMPGDVGFSLLRRKDGSLLLSFSGGLMRVVQGKVLALPDQGNALQAPVGAMAEDQNGRVWMAPWMADNDGYVHRHDGSRYEIVSVSRGGAPGRVESLTVDEAGGLWLAWREGGISYVSATDVAASSNVLAAGRLFTVDDGVCPGRHLVAHAGRKGTVWFGSFDKGISELTPQGARCHQEEGLPEGAILGLFQDEDGAVFAGVNGSSGLFRLQHGRVVRYDQGLNTSVHGITSDRRGNIWFGSANGAYKVRRSDLDAVDHLPRPRTQRVPWLRFSYADGLRSEESIGGPSPAAALDESGWFWYPTLRGFSAVLDSAQRPAAPLAPPVLESVHADQQAFNPHAPATVPPGLSSLTIEYTSPSFTLPNQLSFEYRLDGFDHDWVAAAGRRTAYYTNLPPGHYTFRVRVHRGQGEPVESLRPLALTLRPFFHETWAFYAGFAVALFFAGVAVHRARLRRMETRHSLIHTERARLARELHDHLGQGFTGIGFALDALRAKLRGNESASIADQARGLLEHCQIETRRLVWDLRSEAERHLDLAAALAQVVEHAKVPEGPKIELHIAGKGEVSGMAQHELPLIAQEAIMNALRHAQAKVISVSLRATNESTTITITDDGRGFPPRPGGGAPAQAGHFGLVGMEERARRLQAQLQIHSAPGAGTEISISVATGAK